MEITKRIHPLVAGAAASVILVSLVGVAAITGLLPNSHSTQAPLAGSPAIPATTAATTATTGAGSTTASLAAPVATEDKVGKADAEATAPKHSAPKVVAKHKPAPAPVRVADAQPQISTPASVYTPPPPPVAQAPICSNCGRVISVNAMASQAKPSGLGVAGGAVVGGLLGNQIGNGNGRTLATIAGAVGGGFAGNEVEKRTRSETTYQVRVRMEDGQVRSFPYNQAPNWSVGDRVKVVDGYLNAVG